MGPTLRRPSIRISNRTSFALPGRSDGGQQAFSLGIQIEAVEDGFGVSSSIHDVDVPLGSAETLCEMCIDIILKNWQLILCTQIRNALFSARQIDEDNFCIPQFCAVFIYDFLKLRSLRMTMRSGGLREIDDEHGTQEFIPRALCSKGGRVWIDIL